MNSMSPKEMQKRKGKAYGVTLTRIRSSEKSKKKPLQEKEDPNLTPLAHRPEVGWVYLFSTRAMRTLRRQRRQVVLTASHSPAAQWSWSGSNLRLIVSNPNGLER